MDYERSPIGQRRSHHLDLMSVPIESNCDPVVTAHTHALRQKMLPRIHDVLFSKTVN